MPSEADDKAEARETQSLDKATLLVGVPLGRKPGLVWTAWPVLFNIVPCYPLKQLSY